MKNIEITREQFNEDLYAFASKWAADFQKKVAEQADELYENPVTRYMLHAYAEAKSKHEASQKSAFFFRINSGEAAAMYVQPSIDTNAEKMMKYGEVLNEIIFG